MKKQRLVIDVGNTHTVIGIYTDGLQQCWRLASSRTRTADEYWSLLVSLASQSNIDLKQTETGALACVVPSLTNVFRLIFDKYLHCQLIVVNSNTNLSLIYPIEDPSFIGADLLVDAFAAIKKYNTNCIVCDLGSATTIQLAGQNGYFYGTVICPGLNMSAQSLVSGAAQLPGVDFDEEFNLLGTSTRQAMLSGIIRGHALMIDGFISEIRAEYSALNPIKVVATGGIAKLVYKYSKFIDVVDENLTLDGLDYICQQQGE